MNRYQVGPSYLGDLTLVPKRTDVSCYAGHLCEFQVVYKSIERVLLKHYGSTEVAKKYSENIQSLKES